MLGVSFDDIEENRAFAEKYDFPFELLSDVDRDMGLDYGACDSQDDAVARRISYLIDSEGFVTRAYADVDPSTHAAQLIRDLELLEEES